MLKKLKSLANKFENKLRKIATTPADTDQLEVVITNTNGSHMSLGTWQWSKIKIVCPQLSMLPGITEVEAFFGETTFSWKNGKFSSGQM